MGQAPSLLDRSEAAPRDVLRTYPLIPPRPQYDIGLKHFWEQVRHIFTALTYDEFQGIECQARPRSPLLAGNARRSVPARPCSGAA